MQNNSDVGNATNETNTTVGKASNTEDDYSDKGTSKESILGWILIALQVVAVWLSYLTGYTWIAFFGAIILMIHIAILSYVLVLHPHVVRLDQMLDKYREPFVDKLDRVWRVVDKLERDRTELFTPELPRELLKKYIETIFNSEEFLIALNSSLPKGNSDELHGFDYVPYMLQEVSIRRERALKRSKFFLSLTFITGVFTSCLVVVAAYVILDDNSVGLPKRLADLQQTTNSIKEGVQSMDLPEEQQVWDDVHRALYRVEGSIYKAEDTAAPEQVNKVIEQFRNSSANKAEALQTLQAEFLKVLGEAEKRGTKIEGEPLEEINNVLSNISKHFDKGTQALYQLPNQLEQIDKSIRGVSDHLQKPDNRVAEILKRIFISLVVITFFLALLRYLGRLYREDRQQVLIADHDALTIRKFYVAYKCSTNPSSQAAVVTALMEGASPKETYVEKESDTTLDPKLIKEVLELLAKKI